MQVRECQRSRKKSLLCCHSTNTTPKPLLFHPVHEVHDMNNFPPIKEKNNTPTPTAHVRSLLWTQSPCLGWGSFSGWGSFFARV